MINLPLQGLKLWCLQQFGKSGAKTEPLLVVAIKMFSVWTLQGLKLGSEVQHCRNLTFGHCNKQTFHCCRVALIEPWTTATNEYLTVARLKPLTLAEMYPFTGSGIETGTIAAIYSLTVEGIEHFVVAQFETMTVATLTIAWFETSAEFEPFSLTELQIKSLTSAANKPLTFARIELLH